METWEEILSRNKSAPLDQKPDCSGLDDGPYLPGQSPRKKPTAKSPDEIKKIRQRAWETRRIKYGNMDIDEMTKITQADRIAAAEAFKEAFEIEDDAYGIIKRFLYGSSDESSAVLSARNARLMALDAAIEAIDSAKCECGCWDKIVALKEKAE